MARKINPSQKIAPYHYFLMTASHMNVTKRSLRPFAPRRLDIGDLLVKRAYAVTFGQFLVAVCQLAHNADVQIPKYLHNFGDRSVSRATAVLLKFVVLSGPNRFCYMYF
jgi:hypothetical protein